MFAFVWPLLLAASIHAQELADGLVIDTITPVSCDRPSQSGDLLSVDYRGSLMDGSIFDSSYERNRPFAFDLGGGHVIRGWDEGLVGMCVGEERNLTIPSGLAYGSSGNGIIPPGATLYFEIKLLALKAVEELPSDSVFAKPETIEPETDPDADAHIPTQDASLPQDSSDDIHTVPDTAVEDEKEEGGEIQLLSSELQQQRGECKLLGPFALFVQGGLGILALFSLVWKRWRERPRRPLKIWFFDVSKQLFGSALLHLANLAMSMLSSADLTVSAITIQDEEGNMPNPCSFYLINIFVDTTVGILFLYLILKVLHRAFALTPLAKPKESLRSGNYGNPPRATWWLKQSMIYFIGLFLMKLCVFFLFQMLPWIAWVGAWALKWTEGNEQLQIAFVMFVFPLIMNAIQYYIIDSFIKDKPATEKTEDVYQPVLARDSNSDDSDDDIADEPVGRGSALDEGAKEAAVPSSQSVSLGDDRARTQARRLPKPEEFED